MRKFFGKLARDESGVTSIEYALLASLIAIAIILAVQAVGTNLMALYDKIARCVPNGCS